MQNGGKLVIQGKTESREVIARRLKDHTESASRMEEEKDEEEIENNPQLKAMREEYNEQLKIKEKEGMEDLLQKRLRRKLTEIEGGEKEAKSSSGENSSEGE